MNKRIFSYPIIHILGYKMVQQSTVKLCAFTNRLFWPTAKGGEMHIPYSHYLACLCNVWSGSGCIVIVRAHVGFGDGHVLHLGIGVQGVQEREGYVGLLCLKHFVC